jgi:hypothetical protein
LNNGYLKKRFSKIQCGKIRKFSEKLSKGLTEQKSTDYMQEIFWKDANVVIINFMKMEH